MSLKNPHLREPIRDALRLLGKRRLILAIHDSSFPSLEHEDLGRGSPYTRGGLGFARFAHELGFDALQLAPPGQTSRDNPSPYDGTYFSRNVLLTDLFGLAEDPAFHRLVPRERLEAAVAANPRRGASRTAYRHAYDAVHEALDTAWARLRAAGDDRSATSRPLTGELDAFAWRHREWLERDALYAALSASHDGASFQDWPEAEDRLLYTREDNRVLLRCGELFEQHAEAVERYSFRQFIVHAQQERFHAQMRELGLTLFADLQVGASVADAWGRASLLLPGYRVGAPPSRTNPAGQPWGYGVLDPDQFSTGLAEGPAAAFLRARVGKLLDECDGLRVDHPHGMVCPWVYRADDPDPFHAVQNGARLFESPDLPDHPGLRRYALVRPEQLDRSQPRHADDWVRELLPEQVARFAVRLDAVVEEFQARGRDPQDLACEVLSTMPRPLGRVLSRHGLGRFRVTQKADLDHPADVYRSENARPEDWVMVGTHDTAPLWRLARRWTQPEVVRQAEYLAGRLGPEAECEALARELASDRSRLVHAKVADLFVCPARQVVVFFADLFGIEEVYNAPGTISEDNWSLRLTPDYAARYHQALSDGAALDLGAALALALRAGGPDLLSAHADLVRRLEEPAQSSR